MSFDPISAGLEFVGKIADKIWPDPAAKAEGLLRLQELQQRGELAVLAADTQLAQAQADINKVEAASSNVFVAGWRPFIGWICGLALAYTYFIEPFMRFIASVMFKYTGTFPVIDTSSLQTLVFGMLGLVGARSFEKYKGVA